MPKPLLPSEFLPAFFRLDLSGPSSTAHALLEALDTSLEEVTFAMLSALHTAEVAHREGARLLRELTRLGFSAEQLTETQRKTLLQSLPRLMAQQGTLGAVRALAQIYFAESRVFRGSRFRSESFGHSRGPLRLIDTDASATVVSVELLQDAPLPLIQEFSRNAGLLVPSGYRVHVIPPLRTADLEPSGIRLRGSLTLAERRL